MKYIILALSILLLAGTSCKKLVEIPEDPSDKIPEARIFADSADALSAVVGIYVNFKLVDNYSFNFLNGSIPAFTGLAGDELNTSITYDQDLMALYNNSLLSNTSRTANGWQEAYAGLYQINSCIKGVQESTGLSASLKQQLVGEAKVARALYYFNLVNLFGAVPLVIGTDYKVNAKLPRSSTDQVYAQIIQDLIDARTLLKREYPSAGAARPNLYVATGLLARVYLYTQQWDKAAAMSSEVINSGLYTMQNDLENTFLDGNAEAIWQLPVEGLFSQTAEANSFIPSPGTNPNYFFADPLKNAFEVGDKRMVSWIGMVNISGQDYLYPAKYKSTSPSDPRKEGYVVLRLAEQYLIRAEALVRQNDVDDALEDLKMVRNISRVGLSEYAGPRNQDSVLAAIMKERQTELFCEWGHRWFDLKRTGQADVILGAEKANWQSSDALYPVPLVEIQRNRALTQNPGYN